MPLPIVRYSATNPVLLQTDVAAAIQSLLARTHVKSYPRLFGLTARNSDIQPLKRTNTTSTQSITDADMKMVEAKVTEQGDC